MTPLQQGPALLLVGIAFLLPLQLFADSEIAISPKGIFTGKNLVVQMKSGNNFFTRAQWGNAFIRVTVLVGTSTTITKNYGERMSASEILDKHIIDVEGKLSSGADSIIVNATNIRNSSVTKESKSISGNVKSINAAERSIVVPNTSFGATTIMLSPSITITKGARQIDFSEIMVGDKVVAASGTYEYETNRLVARDIEIFQDKAKFAAKNFQGTLKSLSGTVLPISAVITIDGADYTVFLGTKAEVLNNKKAATNLKRFAEGDTVRIYGKIRQENFGEIDAEVIRDLAF